MSFLLSMPKHEELTVMVVSIARHSEGFLAVRFLFDREVVDAMLIVPDRRLSAIDQAGLIPNGREEGDRLLIAHYNTDIFSLSDSRDAKSAVFSTRRYKPSDELATLLFLLGSAGPLPFLWRSGSRRRRDCRSAQLSSMRLMRESQEGISSREPFILR